ncbi:hypothetical protein YC2023_010972 [Brassica napus]
MVDMPVCCSEHDVSRCFSEHGGTLLMSWRSWPEPPLLGVSKKKVFYVWNLALAAVELMSPGRINHSAWKPKAGGRDPDPGEETQTQGQEPRTWRQESGSRKLENRTSARSLGHQTPLSVVLGCTCARMRRCPHDGDWSELAASLMEKSGAQNFSLHFWRLSGSMNRVEECTGQDPRILRGGILARIRIRGMKRFNKTRRPKLRILMLDSTSLASVASCLVLGLSLDFWMGGVQMFVLVLGDNLVDSSHQSRILGHVVCSERLQSMLGWPCVVLSWNLEDPGHVFPESEDLEIHPFETQGSWLRSFINRRLYGLSSRNPETGWTVVLEPRG